MTDFPIHREIIRDRQPSNGDFISSGCVMVIAAWLLEGPVALYQFQQFVEVDLSRAELQRDRVALIATVSLILLEQCGASKFNTS